ncbi:hypothetical protein ACLOJK_018643, partial [Asimina triloba]
SSSSASHYRLAVVVCHRYCQDTLYRGRADVKPTFLTGYQSHCSPSLGLDSRPRPTPSFQNLS